MRRPDDERKLRTLLGEFPVVAIVGPRQVGKTTLARALGAKRAVTIFDLEDPRHLARLAEPMLALEPLRGLVVIDEVQLRPDLFPALRVLADRRPLPARFLLLGSAGPTLLRQSSESLAGRIAYHELEGFGVGDVGTDMAERLWLRGGYPRAFLARSEAASLRWRSQHLRAFLERDAPALGLRLAPETLRRFWAMMAHYHGQLWNGAELARAFGVSEKTVAHYLDIARGTFMVERLPPWHENLGKRLVRSAKIYVSDTGLLHALLGIRSHEELLLHPKVGASWEGFVLGAVRRHLGAERDQCHFWALHSGAELDLLVVHGGRRFGFEVKRSDAPSLTPSMRHALVDLKLERLDVLHPGAETFPLAERVRAVAFSRLRRDVPPLR
ncbi:MAG: ATP-binding protein [Myxococcales bacterium]|nr:ATP-binding protein [Myxococcales bacterium]